MGGAAATGAVGSNCWEGRGELLLGGEGGAAAGRGLLLGGEGGLLLEGEGGGCRDSNEFWRRILRQDLVQMLTS